MNVIKMVLTNGDELEVAGFSLPLSVVADCSSEDDAIALWQKLKAENLETVSFTNNGEQIAAFSNVNLENVQFVLNNNGTVTAHFYMRGENAVSSETEYVTAAKILLGEEE